ncbi:DUF4064 domain-containing protein [Virgibacillus senegalensis]|uniref:DUF4064 domain-containing protein n=1 Tax=Virgibacillus senegalensis TaxID=1499679 RepID=UPI00069EF581|nr:DUF4064 domain-containing protein [Virgibacillus senegalensis]
MKRTAEIVLGVIGAVLYALFTFFGIVLMTLKGNEAFIQEMENAFAEQGMENMGGDISQMIASGSWYLIIVSLLAVILGIVAVVFLKGNKKPKTAGILLIITAVLTFVLFMGMSLIPALLYLIAGIVALVRKPQTPITA